MNKAYVDCGATPVLFGASKNNLGVSELVQFQSELAVKRKSALDGKKAALAFKLTNDRRLGEITMLRNFSGTFAGKLRLKNSCFPLEVFSTHFCTHLSAGNLGEISLQSIGHEKRVEKHEVLQSLGEYFGAD